MAICPYNNQKHNHWCASRLYCPCNDPSKAAVWCKNHLVYHLTQNAGDWRCDIDWSKTRNMNQANDYSQRQNAKSSELSRLNKQMRLNGEQQKLHDEFEVVGTNCTSQAMALSSFRSWLATCSNINFTPEQKKLLHRGLASAIGPK